MNIVGIITEYNPFHNGHLHHLQTAKKDADFLICVMAGNFTMRGEFSPIDKWMKTEVALKYGVDLVIELPLVYVVQSADNFALASVSILEQLGVTKMYFGSESNDLCLIKRVLEISKEDKYNALVKEFLSQGFAYPKATSEALRFYNILPLGSGDQLNVSYLRAIEHLNSKIIPCSILRENYASATQIRKMNEIFSHVPKEINEFFLQYGFNDFSRYKKYLTYKQIINANANNIFGASEGIENSDFTPTKRYTQSRINRFLLMNLLDIKKDDFNPNTPPPYIRVLGMNKIGMLYLNKIKKNINLITNAKENINPLLDIELKSSKIYALEYHFDTFMAEFKKPIIK